MNIPDKFTFFNQNRTLKLTNINGDFYCTLPEVDADTISSAIYDRRNVEHKLASGKWKIVADLTVAEKDPEMKFPFVVKCSLPPFYSYKITEGGSSNSVGVESADNPKTFEKGDWWTKDYVKAAIKEGKFIVQSVGEQAAKEEPAKKVGFHYPYLYDSNGVVRMTFPHYDTDKEIVEPVPEYGADSYTPSSSLRIENAAITAEKVTVGDLSKLTMSVGSEGIDEATAKMERLAQATENVTMAFESLQSVLDDMGLSFGSTFTYETYGGPVEDLFEVRDGGKPFCCGED